MQVTPDRRVRSVESARDLRDRPALRAVMLREQDVAAALDAACFCTGGGRYDGIGCVQ
jgi:hypothetical protein